MMTSSDLGSIINSAIQGGYVAHLAPATYTITTPIVIHITRTTTGPLGLDGGGATFVSQVTNGQPLIQFVVEPGVDLRYLTLSNFTILGNGQEGSGISIVAPSNDSWVYNWNISDVTVEGVGGYGLNVHGSVFEGIVSNSSMIDNGQGGAYFGHSSVGGQVSALRWFGGAIEGNGGPGIMLDNGARDISVDGVSFTGNAGFGISAEWGITSVSASSFTDNQGIGVWFQNFGHFNDNTFVSSGAQDVGISGYIVGNASLIGNQSSASPGSSETPVLANIQGHGGLFMTGGSGPVVTGAQVAVSGEGGGNLAQVTVSSSGVTVPTLDAVTSAVVAPAPAGTVPSVLEGVLKQAIVTGVVSQIDDTTNYTVSSTIKINITSSSQAAQGIDLGGAKIHSQITGGAPVIEIVVAAGVDVGTLVLSNFSIYGNGSEGSGIRVVSAASGSSVSLDMRDVNIEHVGGIGLDLIGDVSGTVFNSWMHGNLDGGARIAAAVDGGVTGDIDWIGGGFRKNGVAGLILDNGATDVEVKGAYFCENYGPGIIATDGIALVRNSGFENNQGVGAIVGGSSRFVDTTFSTHGPQKVAVGGQLSGDTVTLIGVSNEYYGGGADTTVVANFQGSGTLGIAGGGKVVAGPGVSVTGAELAVAPPADTTAPVATSIAASGASINAGAGTLVAGAAVTLTVTLSEAVTVTGGTPSLVLNDGGTATYTGGSGGTTLAFTHVVQAGQSAADLAVSSVSLNGATIKDAAGNTANLALATNYNPAGVLKIDAAAPTTPTTPTTPTSPTAPTTPVVDTVAPVPVILSAVIVDGRVTISGTTGSANDTIWIYDGNAWLGGATSDAQGQWSFTGNADPNAAHSYGVLATDLAGNVGRSAQPFVPGTSTTPTAPTTPTTPTAPTTPVVDTVAPVPVILSAVIVDGRVTISGTTGSANDTIWIYDGNAWLGGATSDAQGQWSFTGNADPNAAHSYAVLATDLAGNVGRSAQPFAPGTSTTTPTTPTTPVVDTPVVDTTAPVPNITSVGMVNGRVTMSGSTDSAGDTVTIYGDGAWLGSATGGVDGTWSFSANANPNTVHSYGIYATDLAGNEAKGTGKAILGSVGADTLVGTAGNDVIGGNGGADVLTGGAGQDTFAFTAAGKATVTDFQSGTDKFDFAALAGARDLQVQGAIVGTGTLGAQSVGWIDTGADMLLLVNTSDVAQSVSAAAPQNAELQIVLLGVNQLTATDLLST